MDVVTLRKNVGMTIDTLKRCRDECYFDNIWELTAE